MEQTKRSHVPSARWWRIVAVAFMLYAISFMDRINLGFGFTGMQKDLGFNATISGLVGSIFFVGYFLLQIPGGQIAQKWSAKWFILICMLIWGLCAAATGIVQNTAQLFAIRFLLGLAEGGVYPAMMVLLRSWFPASERGRALSYFILCVPLGSMFISPISGLILAVSSWRTMFIVEGLFPFVWALFWIWLIADSPAKARWLSAEERAYLEAEFQKETVSTPQRTGTLGEALRNSSVWLMVLIYFLLQIGQYGIGLWLPTVVKAISGGNSVLVGFITALPWLAGGIGLVINGRHSDKTGERKFHVGSVVIIGGIFLLISTLLGKNNAIPSIIALILAVGFFQAYNGVVWAIPAELVDASILGVVAGLINGVGTLGGGFIGPLVVGYLITQTGNILAGEIFLVIALILAGLLISMLKLQTGKRSRETLSSSALSESTGSTGV